MPKTDAYARPKQGSIQTGRKKPKDEEGTLKYKQQKARQTKQMRVMFCPHIFSPHRTDEPRGKTADQNWEEHLLPAKADLFLGDKGNPKTQSNRPQKGRVSQHTGQTN